jgi:phosphoribosylformylglycinamidine (FGAM) synthase-like enzyme
MNVALFGNSVLRSAIQRNLVSFPSQIPAFVKYGDMQERVVQLYFVRGWQMRKICDRYRLSKSTVGKLISEWKIRAVAAGYIQEIHTEALAALASEKDVDQNEASEQSAPDPDFTASGGSTWERAQPLRHARVAGAPVRV